MKDLTKIVSKDKIPKLRHTHYANPHLRIVEGCVFWSGPGGGCWETDKITSTFLSLSGVPLPSLLPEYRPAPSCSGS